MRYKVGTSLHYKQGTMATKQSHLLRELANDLVWLSIILGAVYCLFS